MIGLLNKKIITREITVLHLLLLVTGKLFLGVGIGIAIANYVLPYSYPLIVIGALILLPTLYHLFKAEEEGDIKLKRKLN